MLCWFYLTAPAYNYLITCRSRLAPACAVSTGEGGRRRAPQQTGLPGRTRVVVAGGGAAAKTPCYKKLKKLQKQKVLCLRRP